MTNLQQHPYADIRATTSGGKSYKIKIQSRDKAYRHGREICPKESKTTTGHKALYDRL